MTNDSERYNQLIRLVRAARGLQAGGFYGASKLLWGLAFAEEMRASSEQGIPRGDALDAEVGTILDTLKAAGGKPDVIAALEAGRAGARENRTISHSEIPDVYVCRSCGEVILGEPAERCPTCRAHALTFRKIPPIYYFDWLSPNDALGALEAGPFRVEMAISGLTEAQMMQAPAPGEWSVRELLWHLLFAQRLLEFRVDKILTEERPSLAASAAWNDTPEAGLSAGNILEQYRAARESTLSRLKGITPSDWWRTGWHDEFAEVTLLAQATYFARHEHGHLAQFDEIRRAIGA